MKAIETYEIVKKFGKVTALNGVELEVNEGELYGLLGMNGAGKTTLIRTLSGLIAPTSGRGSICGKSILQKSKEIKQIIAVSPQETSVAPNLTVKENLEFFADIYAVENKKERIGFVTDTFSLGEVMARRAKNLSGGWQRRLSIAIALISSPKVLFLDEPTLGLDVLARRELWDIIRTLKGKLTIVLTSHYLEEIEILCDRVGIISKGKLIFSGTTARLKNSAGTESFEEAFVKLCEGDGEK